METPRPGLGKGRRVGLAVAGLAAVLALTVSGCKGSGLPDLSKYAKGTLTKMTVVKAPAPVAPIPFTDADGKTVTVADFKGKVVVMNIWATWCGPCKVEMPTLGRLQAAYAGKPLLVAAVSVDRDDDLNLAKAQIAADGPLTLFRDPGYKLAFSLTPKVEGFPTTLIIDSKGRERARMAGDAKWDAPEVKALIDSLLSES